MTQSCPPYFQAVEPVPLGWSPININPIFSRGQDWLVTIVQPSTYAWPDDTTITVSVYSSTTNTSLPITDWVEEFRWDATISGNTVYIKAPYTDTDQVEAGALMRVYVSIPDTPDADNYVWLRGTVTRRD
jgi:hypothetical protein